MQLDWRLKSLAFNILNIFGLYKFLYFLQKNVSKRSRLIIDDIPANWDIHRSVIENIDAPSLIEFGAGKSLAQNVYLSLCAKGGLEQLVIDLFPMIDLEQVDDAASQITKLLGLETVEIDDLEALKERLGIEYRAPFDLANDDEVRGIDVCISTNTLEHIPEEDIVKIFESLRKILKKGGKISAIIDYSDHYAHTDKGIGRLNFLKFSDSTWKWHNTPMHYQNRLRHQDFRRIFSALGYQIIGDDVLKREEPPSLIHQRFDRNNEETFAISGHFILINQ